MYIHPQWPAPAGVHAYTSTRAGGVSYKPFDTFNLGDHAGDSHEHVIRNRSKLRSDLLLPREPVWLDQQHTCTVVSADAIHHVPPVADASIAFKPGHVCAVMTADCLPLLMTDTQGTQVAAIHAGWRGLADGIIAATVKQLKGHPQDLLVWLGPAIGPKVYEVGAEVRTAFLSQETASEAHFAPLSNGKYLLDMYGAARHQLASLGITAVYGGDYCTYSDPTRFYSYRRDGVTGRMVSLIWRDPS